MSKGPAQLVERPGGRRVFALLAVAIFAPPTVVRAALVVAVVEALLI